MVYGMCYVITYVCLWMVKVYSGCTSIYLRGRSTPALSWKMSKRNRFFREEARIDNGEKTTSLRRGAGKNGQPRVKE